jgi:hypothetical protein
VPYNDDDDDDGDDYDVVDDDDETWCRFSVLTTTLHIYFASLIGYNKTL